MLQRSLAQAWWNDPEYWCWMNDSALDPVGRVR